MNHIIFTEQPCVTVAPDVKKLKVLLVFFRLIFYYKVGDFLFFVAGDPA